MEQSGWGFFLVLVLFLFWLLLFFYSIEFVPSGFTRYSVSSLLPLLIPLLLKQPWLHSVVWGQEPRPAPQTLRVAGVGGWMNGLLEAVKQPIWPQLE